MAEVPRDIMDRNLKKASDKSQADFSEVTMHCVPCCCSRHTACLLARRQMPVPQGWFVIRADDV